MGENTAENSTMNVTVFDTETTGLIDNPARKLEKQPEIVSIAIQNINLATGELGGEYYQMFKPTRPIPQDVTKIHGITNEMVENSPSIELALSYIIGTLEMSQLIIGQNISFDKSMVELECKRYNRSIKWPKTMDLVENSIFTKGYRLSLTNLHMELFGTNFDSAHRANVDVLITAKCATEMFRRGWL